MIKTILWALFGNDEDGPYGPPYDGRETFFPRTRWGAVRWWLRNPCHNLFWHVINWPGGPLFKFGKRPGLNGYIGWRPRPDGNGVFGAAFRYERH